MKTKTSLEVKSLCSDSSKKRRNKNQRNNRKMRRTSMGSSSSSESRQSTRNHSEMSQCSSPKRRGGKRKNDSLVASDHAPVLDSSGTASASGNWSISNEMSNVSVNDDVGPPWNLKIISKSLNSPNVHK